MGDRLGPAYAIKGFFDNVDHESLMGLVRRRVSDRRVLKLIAQWLRSGVVVEGRRQATVCGVPQGGVISPLLANIYLHTLDRYWQDNHTGVGRLYRYADDFVVTGSSKELLEGEVRPLVEQFMRERGLELSPEKTVVTHIEDGFDFLGFNVRKYGSKLLIKPSRKNVKAFLCKVRKVIRTNRPTPAGELIRQLNSLIRGWANYHRHVVSKRTFDAVDHAIFVALWNWAKRRHQRKNRHWIKDRYFRRHDSREWVFTGQVTDAHELAREIRLFSASSVAIKRHTKIRGEANPYDLSWQAYFDARHGRRSLSHEANLRNTTRPEGNKLPRNKRCVTASGDTGVSRGLSRVLGNQPARF